jgi:hypothetical protein
MTDHGETDRQTPHFAVQPSVHSHEYTGPACGSVLEGVTGRSRIPHAPSSGVVGKRFEEAPPSVQF